MPGISAQLVNGMFYDYSSIEVTMVGGRFSAFKAVNYSDTLTPGEIAGTAAPLLGRTRGQYRAEAGFEMFLSDFDLFTTALIALSPTSGIMEIPFDISVVYSELTGPGVKNDIIKGCRIKKIDTSHSNGAEGLTVKVDLSTLLIIRNGKAPVGIPQAFTGR